MAARLTSALPRFVALTAILILGSATISFAAENQFGAAETPTTVAAVPQELVTVPDVRGQAYVFAKGTLEESGYAWQVVGSVQGYPANVVSTQTPAAGTRIVDTGMPTIRLGLSRGRYAEQGTPENASPYDGSEVRLPSRPKPAPKPKPVAKPKPKPAPRPKPAAQPQPKPQPKPASAPARQPAFSLAGAPQEPLGEITLPARATRLERWVQAHPKPTTANVRHWLYQHEWIVTGARFGWSHGAEALRILIRVDERVQRQWEIGAKSEAAARRALAVVRAKSR